MVIISILVVLLICIYVFMQQPQFGKAPSGPRLEKIKKSPNYKNGKFQNINVTPDLTEGLSYLKVLKEFLFDRSKRSTPASVLPSKKTDLFTLNPNTDIVVWFGHSSYFMQIDGKKILVDPVLSGSASPVKPTTRSYPGSDIYTTDDIPGIDYLFISHDHWDHLDFETVTKLKPKIRRIITGLGTAEHFAHWGFDKDIIEERDWYEKVDLESGFTAYVTPARHFSGRSLGRNTVLWASFVFQTPNRNIYIGGDSGYDTHFAEIGKQYGPFDLAFLECGQYNKNWKYIHMMPEETVQAAIDLRTKKMMPVHWGKFTLAQHAWDESIIRAKHEGQQKQMTVIHPMIGEALELDGNNGHYEWWNEVKQ